VRKQSASIWVVILKLGPKMLSLLVKFGKFISVGKVGLAAASIAGYTMLFSWQFAVVIVGSILFHEYGHLWAMKKRGLKTKGIYLIPFFGGAAVAEESFKTRNNEAFIGLFGPIFGLGLAVVVLIGYYFTRNSFMAAIAGWMGLINIFNLLPVNPLDGGRIIKSVTFSISNKLGLIFLTIGLILGAYMAAKLRIYIFTLLFVLALIELSGEFRDYLKIKYQKNLSDALDIGDDTPPPMPSMRFWGGLAAFVSYLTLIVLLFSVILATSHVPGAKIALDILVDSASKSGAQADVIMPFWKALLVPIVVLFFLFCLTAWFINSIWTFSKLFKEMRQLDKLSSQYPDLLKEIGKAVKVYKDKDHTEDQMTAATEVLRQYCYINGYNVEDLVGVLEMLIGGAKEEISQKLLRASL
jgi:Zn-dependent protease